MKTKLLLLVVAALVSSAVADDRDSGQRAIRDSSGKIVAYKERTVNGTRYRDTEQKIIATVEKKDGERPTSNVQRSTSKPEPKK